MDVRLPSVLPSISYYTVRWILMKFGLHFLCYRFQVVCVMIIGLLTRYKLLRACVQFVRTFHICFPTRVTSDVRHVTNGVEHLRILWKSAQEKPYSCYGCKTNYIYACSHETLYHIESKGHPARVGVMCHRVHHLQPCFPCFLWEIEITHVSCSESSQRTCMVMGN
jgi:hypothetical protein